MLLTRSLALPPSFSFTFLSLSSVFSRLDFLCPSSETLFFHLPRVVELRRKKGEKRKQAQQQQWLRGHRGKRNSLSLFLSSRSASSLSHSLNTLTLYSLSFFLFLLLVSDFSQWLPRVACLSSCLSSACSWQGSRAPQLLLLRTRLQLPRPTWCVSSFVFQLRFFFSSFLFDSSAATDAAQSSRSLPASRALSFLLSLVR